MSVKSGYKEVPGQHHLKRIKRSEGFKVSSSSFSLKTGQQGIQGFLSTWMPNPSKSDSSGVGSFTLRGCHLARATTINQRQEQEQKSTKAMKKNATLDTGAGESGSHARYTRPCKLDCQSEEPPMVRPPRSSTPASVRLKCNLPSFTLVPLYSTDLLYGGLLLYIF